MGGAGGRGELALRLNRLDPSSSVSSNHQEAACSVTPKSCGLLISFIYGKMRWEVFEQKKKSDTCKNQRKTWDNKLQRVENNGTC